VNHLLEKGVTRTRACRLVCLSVPSSRFIPKERNRELAKQVLELAHKNPRYGFRVVI
jgi:DNA repair photolyase